MPYFDLRTGELYGSIIYQDAAHLVFWTEGRESQIDAAAFAEKVVVIDEKHEPEEVGFFWRNPPTPVDRFQAVEPFGQDVAEAITRRMALSDYAAGNGGQIATHLAGETPPASPTLGARLRRLFTPS